MAAARRSSHELTDRTVERIADTMFALSAPSRLRIVASLRSGPRTVSEIVAAVGMEQSAVSHQLRVLREHQVLTVRHIGRTRSYELTDEHLAALLDQALAHVGTHEQPPSRRAEQFADASPGGLLAAPPRWDV